MILHLPVEIAASGFNKGSLALLSMGITYSAFMRGCLDDCDLSGWLYRACGVAKILLRVFGEVDRTGWLDTVQCQILGYTQKSGTIVTVLMSGACTRSE